MQFTDGTSRDLGGATQEERAGVRQDRLWDASESEWVDVWHCAHPSAVKFNLVTGRVECIACGTIYEVRRRD